MDEKFCLLIVLLYDKEKGKGRIRTCYAYGIISKRWFLYGYYSETKLGTHQNLFSRLSRSNRNEKPVSSKIQGVGNGTILMWKTNPAFGKLSQRRLEEAGFLVLLRGWVEAME
jgi:hypothetical protein